MVEDDTKVRAECRNCGASVDPGYAGPCPACNQSAGKNVCLTITTKVTTASSMKALGVEEGKGLSNFFVRIQHWQELFRKTGQMHEGQRIVDRRNNRYYEYIVNMETGKVEKHKDEPLRGPRGHVAERDLRRKEHSEDG